MLQGAISFPKVVSFRQKNISGTAQSFSCYSVIGS